MKNKKKSSPHSPHSPRMDSGRSGATSLVFKQSTQPPYRPTIHDATDSVGGKTFLDNSDTQVLEYQPLGERGELFQPTFRIWFQEKKSKKYFLMMMKIKKVQYFFPPFPPKLINST